MFQNDETAAIVVYQTNPVGVEKHSQNRNKHLKAETRTKKYKTEPQNWKRI